MGSVEFSDSYRTVALGYPTNYVRINYTELEYDSATNRTKIRLDGVYLKSSLNIGSTAVYGTLKIAGTTVLTMSGGSYQCSINTSYNLVSYSGNNAIVWVQHNNDGTASMSVSLTGGKANDDNNNVFGGYVGIMSGKAVFGVRTTATKNVPLTTRPRGSTITSSTANAATNGAFSLVMDRKDSSYYHIATFSYGDDVLFTSAQFDTSLNFTVPRSWFAEYPSLASIPVTVSVQTYNSGGTAIGSPATANLTVTADADMKPSVSSGWATVVPYNVGGVAGFTGYVKNYSKAEATFDSTKIDMSNAVGASIASYSVTCQGETVSTSPYRTPTIASTSVSVVCTVTDTRGRTASETFALTVMDYSAPVLTGQTVFRCDSLGVADEDGQYFSVKAVLSYASVGGQNSCSLKCAAAAAGGTYGTETSMTSGTASFIGQYSADTTYTVRIRAVDTIGNTAEWTITMPTRKWAMKFRPTGNGVAFGKAAETDNLFEVTEDWDVKFGGDLYVDGTIHGQGGGGGGSGIAISDTEPTGDELVWIDTDDDGSVHQVLELSDFDSASGHCKMPDGTLIQWGSLIVEQGSTAQYVGQTYQMPVSLSLPIPFVDTNYRVFGSSKFGSGGAIAIGHDVSQSTASSAYIRAWDYTPRTLSSSVVLQIWWTAIGRWR